MRVFLQVADEGGFAAAARKLDLAPAVVTRLVSDLEKHLGVRLLQRTTRRVSLTPAGEAYLARVRAILADIDEAFSVASAHSREMSGTIRILAPPVIATHLLAPTVSDFQRLHPEVLLDIVVEDHADPPVEEYDLTLASGMTQLHPNTIVRTIIESSAVFCASPAYLRQHPAPVHPRDLLAHRCLRLRMPSTRLRPWVLVDPTREDEKVEVDAPSVMTANHTDTLLRATVDGAGISSQPEDLLAPLVQSGQLVRVLAPWITNRLSIVAALPSRKYLPARTRAFLDHVIEHTRHTMAAARNGLEG